jgi:hypothetical protein
MRFEGHTFLKRIFSNYKTVQHRKSITIHQVRLSERNPAANLNLNILLWNNQISLIGIL